MSRSGALGFDTLLSAGLGGCTGGGADGAAGGSSADAGAGITSSDEVCRPKCGGARSLVCPPLSTVGEAACLGGSGGRDATIVSLMSRTGALGFGGLGSGGLGSAGRGDSKDPTMVRLGSNAGCSDINRPPSKVQNF
jgi:hypothetical protein